MAPMMEMLRRARKGARTALEYLALGLAGDSVERRTHFERCDHPVLLLHGFLATRRSLLVLERRLRRDGYGTFSFRLGGLAGRFNARRIDELAALVHDKVARLYERHPRLGPLTVIGHSLGGLIAAYWVKRLGGHAHVRAVVTLGTPHRGVPIARAALFAAPLLPSVAQMAPESALLRRLAEEPWPAHVRVTAVYSRGDRVAPHPTATLHATGRVRNLEVMGTHGEFLLRSRIYEAVLRELRADPPGASPAAVIRVAVRHVPGPRPPWLIEPRSRTG